MALRDLLILQRAIDDLEDMLDDPRLSPTQKAGYLSEYERLCKRMRAAKKRDRKEYDR